MYVCIFNKIFSVLYRSFVIYIYIYIYVYIHIYIYMHVYTKNKRNSGCNTDMYIYLDI